MQVDSSIELGRDDPALEFPWASEDGSLCYKDLRNDPGLIEQIPEAEQYSELRDLLLRLNASEFALQTAKSDVWTTDEIPAEEEIFSARQKLVSYVDLIFSSDQSRFCLKSHTDLVKKLCTLLQRAPDMAASVEFVVRRCYYHQFERTAPDPQSGPEHPSRSGAGQSMSAKEGEQLHAGFCITAYVSGFGDTDQEARQRWSIALKLMQHALVQAARS